MPYCERCGKQLEDGQICSCTANQNPNLNQENIQPPPPLYNQAVYANGYNNMNDPNAPKKKSKVWPIILIIAIPLLLIALVVVGILAAIFVPAMIGYTNKSKLAAQNSYSSSISKAINTAMTELDEEGYNVYGNYFICSNGSNSFCFDCDSDRLDYYDLNNRINDYFSDSENGCWFAVYEYGTITYVASAELWESENVGTYPTPSSLDAAKGYNSLGKGGISYSDKEELGDIYEDTLDIIMRSY